jgi:tripartite-type tricarboxylate transporter receptor subunit TctC
MQALKTPELDQRIRDMGVEPMPMTPDEFQAYAQRERAEWATVIERAGIRMD